MSVRDVVQAAAGALGGANPYIEDVFSTYLYTGTNSTQTITNGIDLDGEGGMVWMKSRTASTTANHNLYDTERGVKKPIYSNLTDSEGSSGLNGLQTFNTDGFTLGGNYYGENISGDATVSWTFRKAPKFFDVVTYTGDGNTSQTILHNLGSIPGCIIVKMSSGTNNWQTYHRSIGNDKAIQLNLTNAASASSSAYWNSTDPTDTTFTVGSVSNASGSTYVAYLFAHDAGGFGDAGDENVISCGSYTGNGTTQSISLGYEPQWIMIKRTDAANSWVMMDNMRGMGQSYNNALAAQSSAAEAGDTTVTDRFGLTSTGFSLGPTGSSALNLSGGTYIYIAIRRGPMKTPTDGTSVFSPVTRSGTGGATTVSSTNRPDTVIENWRDGAYGSADHYVVDRIRGYQKTIFTNLTAAESTQTTNISAMNNVSYEFSGSSMNASGGTFVDYVFTRAPGFFDVVTWTGDGTANRTVNHNLGVAPELMIVKTRTNADYGWMVYASPIYGTGVGGTSGYDLMQLQLNAKAQYSNSLNFPSAPTDELITLGSDTSFLNWTNYSGDNYVAYLFASCPGVSKVGSYTGGSGQVINCGFSSGARFVLIKRTDSTGDWYVWDSARGITVSSDPYLLLNSTAAEATSDDYLSPASSGFEINAGGSPINESGGTYIYLAIA